jgi:hypothetical protein
MQAQPSGAPAAASRDPAGELNSLSRVTWYAVLNLAASLFDAVATVAILSTFLAAGLGFFPGLAIARSGPTPQQLQGMTIAFQYMTTLIPVTLLLLLASLVLLWTGFRGLSRTGAHEFSLPSKFTLVSVVAVLLLTPGTLLVFSSVVPLMASIGQSGGVGSGLGSVLAGAGLSVIGALLSVIGIIGGQILGLWRVGGRYGQTTLKAGAILTIIPLLSVVAPILVIIGVSAAKARVRQSQPTSP